MSAPVQTKTQKPWTGDELHRLPPGWRYEIDAGELVIMAPASFEHHDITTEIARRLGNFVHDHKLGKVLTNVYLSHEPDTLRGLAVAFYSDERLAHIKDRRGYPDVPSALAVEVHDPSEPDIHRKIAQYLVAGVRSVWVIAPATRTLCQHRPATAPDTIAGTDALVPNPVLARFSCRLAELLGEA